MDKNCLEKEKPDENGAVYKNGSYSIRLRKKHGMEYYEGYDEETILFTRWSFEAALSNLMKLMYDNCSIKDTSKFTGSIPEKDKNEIKLLVDGIETIRKKINSGENTMAVLENYGNLVDCLIHTLAKNIKK